jgi:hypothetical protein
MIGVIAKKLFLKELWVQDCTVPAATGVPVKLLIIQLVAAKKCPTKGLAADR